MDGYLGIMNFMVVNSCIAWNISAILKEFSGPHLTMQYGECLLLNICKIGKIWWIKMNHQWCFLLLLTTTLQTYIKNRTCMYLVFSLWFRNKYLEKSWNLHCWHWWPIMKSYCNLFEYQMWNFCTLSCFALKQIVYFQDSRVSWIVLFSDFSSWII